MKKVLVAFLLILMLFTVCACSYVPSTSFLSRSKVNALVKEYGTPQAIVTLTYDITEGSVTKTRVVEITYDLLLSQTPLAVIRFIQLANEGFYNDTIIDTYNSDYYFGILGRYAYRLSDDAEDSDTYKYYTNESDRTFAGEFKSNDYKAPSGGYPQFSTFALAMYHEDNGNAFDSSNGTLILDLGTTLNANNYAVFATMQTLRYKYNAKDENVDWSLPRPNVPSDILGELKYTGKASHDVVGVSSKVSMMNRRVVVHVEVLDGNGRVSDWSKLPRIGR